MDNGTDDRNAALRAVLAERLLAFAGDATPADVEDILASIERFYTAIPQGQHVRFVLRLADATGLPAPLVALWMYHGVALLRTSEGADLLLYLACRAAAVHGIAPELTQALERAAKRPPTTRGH
jgi:hypothetical protein